MQTNIEITKDGIVAVDWNRGLLAGSPALTKGCSNITDEVRRCNPEIVFDQRCRRAGILEALGDKKGAQKCWEEAEMVLEFV